MYNMKQYAGQIERGLITKDQIARRTVASIENRFGEMNWDNFWMNKTWKTALQLLFRSYTWQAGTWRGFGTAAKRIPEQIKFAYDAVKNGEKPPIDQDLSWIVGLVATHVAEAALIGYGAAAITGNEELKPQTWFDYIFPKISLVTRLSIPGYVKEPISLYQSMKKDRWHIPASYVESKMTGYIGKIRELRNNKDFYGNKIYDERASLSEKGKDIAGHMVVKPFSLTSYLAEEKEGGGTGQAILSGAGFQKAPWWVGKTEVETRLSSMQRHMEEGRTKEQAEKYKSKQQFEKRLREGDPTVDDDISEAQEEGKLTKQEIKTIRHRATQSPVELRAQHVDIPDVVELIKIANPEEKEILTSLFWKKLRNNKTMSKEDKEYYRELVKEQEE